MNVVLKLLVLPIAFLISCVLILLAAAIGFGLGFAAMALIYKAFVGNLDGIAILVPIIVGTLCAHRAVQGLASYRP